MPLTRRARQSFVIGEPDRLAIASATVGNQPTVARVSALETSTVERRRERRRPGISVLGLWQRLRMSGPSGSAESVDKARAPRKLSTLTYIV